MTPEANRIYFLALDACRDRTGKAEAAVLVEFLCEWIARERAGGYNRVFTSAEGKSVVS